MHFDHLQGVFPKPEPKEVSDTSSSNTLALLMRCEFASTPQFSLYTCQLQGRYHQGIMSNISNAKRFSSRAKLRKELKYAKQRFIELRLYEVAKVYKQER